VFKVTENDLRKMIGEAVEASINEILPPVVTRSVTIAVITTRELVLKDFAFDGSLEKLTLAVDNIMQNLAGALALVTCRDPLRLSLNDHLLRQL
jgi:CCR4-NOT transcription complex subunit 1